MGLVLLASLGAAAVTESAAATERVVVNYMVHCQGCHLADGAGLAGRVPPLKGQVARFLSVPGGREFLVRVPGMSHAHLSSRDKAELLNWLLARFDREHLPATFVPYTAEEVERLEKVKIDDVMAVRNALAARFRRAKRSE